MLRMLLPLLTRLLLELLPLMTMARPQLPRPSRHQVSRTRTPSSFIYCNNAASSNAIAVVFDIARDSSRLSPRHLGIILCGECKGVGKVTQEYAARAS